MDDRKYGMKMGKIRLQTEMLRISQRSHSLIFLPCAFIPLSKTGDGTQRMKVVELTRKVVEGRIPACTRC